MNTPLAPLGEHSDWGPVLAVAGALGLAAGTVVHWMMGLPTILDPRPGEDGKPPRFSERLSVHLVVYSLWAIGFGLIVWRGPLAGMLDPRFAFEKSWPVVQGAEWIYLTSYAVPLVLPWLPVRRGHLRRFCLNLWWLLIFCGIFFLFVPIGPAPRPFAPSSLGGRILAWDTGRPDFSAVGLPSFHVCWALLCAGFIATLGRGWARWGYLWALAVAVSCVATGAHALADVAAAVVAYWLVASPLAPVLRMAEAILFGARDR
jgi:PAP2 superfamily